MRNERDAERAKRCEADGHGADAVSLARVKQPETSVASPQIVGGMIRWNLRPDSRAGVKNRESGGARPR